MVIAVEICSALTTTTGGDPRVAAASTGAASWPAPLALASSSPSPARCVSRPATTLLGQSPLLRLFGLVAVAVVASARPGRRHPRSCLLVGRGAHPEHALEGQHIAVRVVRLARVVVI